MLQYLGRRNTNMFPFVSLSSQAYIRANHIQRVCEIAAKPMYTDAHNCDLLVPTFMSSSAVTLTNSMELFSSRACQDLSSAIAGATEFAYAVPVEPVAISDRITVDPAYIVAVLPYNPQICDCVGEHGYVIYPASRKPQCLILLEDDTCLAVDITPSELMDKLNAQQT